MSKIRKIVTAIIITTIMSIINVSASSGALRRNSIKTCPNGKIYGQHSSDDHWHEAEPSDTKSGYTAIGEPMYSDPCPSKVVVEEQIPEPEQIPTPTPEPIEPAEEQFVEIPTVEPPKENNYSNANSDNNIDSNETIQNEEQEQVEENNEEIEEIVEEPQEETNENVESVVASVVANNVENSENAEEEDGAGALGLGLLGTGGAAAYYLGVKKNKR